MPKNRICPLLSITVTICLFLPPMAAQARKTKIARPSSAFITQIEHAVGSPRGAVQSIRVIKESGGRVSWSPRGDRILFDMQDANGYYKVHLIHPDGSGEECLTCDTAGVLANGHHGTAEWHPSGKYIVFQAQKRKFTGKWGLDKAANPGNGRYSDIWLMEVGSRKLHRLTHTAETHDTGVLHPHFSHNGDKLTWSEMYARPKPGRKGRQAGLWKVKVGEFTFAGGAPQLTNIQSFDPGGPSLYENHGLAPGGRKILFTSFFESKGVLDFFNAANIYQYDMLNQQLETLASEGYNEHANYFPNGRKILWMTSNGNPNRGTDYWSMNPDGTGKRRLTDFNNPDTPGFKRKMVIAADASFSPDGGRLAAFLQDGLSYTGALVIIEFDMARLD